jgi:hypothetical protein
VSININVAAVITFTNFIFVALFLNQFCQCLLRLKDALIAQYATN